MVALCCAPGSDGEKELGPATIHVETGRSLFVGAAPLLEQGIVNAGIVNHHGLLKQHDAITNQVKRYVHTLGISSREIMKSGLMLFFFSPANRHCELRQTTVANDAKPSLGSLLTTFGGGGFGAVRPADDAAVQVHDQHKARHITPTKGSSKT